MGREILTQDNTKKCYWEETKVLDEKPLCGPPSLIYPMSWNTITLSWFPYTLMEIIMLIGRLGWKLSWNPLMREYSCLLRIVRSNFPWVFTLKLLVSLVFLDNHIVFFFVFLFFCLFVCLLLLLFLFCFFLFVCFCFCFFVLFFFFFPLLYMIWSVLI